MQVGHVGEKLVSRVGHAVVVRGVEEEWIQTLGTESGRSNRRRRTDRLP